MAFWPLRTIQRSSSTGAVVVYAPAADPPLASGDPTPPRHISRIAHSFRSGGARLAGTRHESHSGSGPDVACLANYPPAFLRGSRQSGAEPICVFAFIDCALLNRRDRRRGRALDFCGSMLGHLVGKESKLETQSAAWPDSWLDVAGKVFDCTDVLRGSGLDPDSHACRCQTGPARLELLVRPGNNRGRFHNGVGRFLFSRVTSHHSSRHPHRYISELGAAYCESSSQSK